MSIQKKTWSQYGNADKSLATIQPTSYTLGYDLEIFIEDGNGKIVPAEIALIAGWKKHIPREYFAEIDGMAFEVKVLEQSCREDVSLSIYNRLKNIPKILKKGYIISNKTFGFIDKFDEAKEENKELGCEPDFNVYTEDINRIPPNAAMLPFRSVGGHIHIGINELIPFELTFKNGRKQIINGSLTNLYGKTKTKSVKKHHLNSLEVRSDGSIARPKVSRTAAIRFATFNVHKDDTNKISKNQFIAATSTIPIKDTKIEVMDHFSPALVNIKKNISMIVKIIDRIGAMPFILFDGTEDSTKRRTLYGKAGSYRPTPWGLEYRVLSNKWMHNQVFSSYVFLAVREALQISEMHEKVEYLIDNKLIIGLRGPSEKEIQKRDFILNVISDKDVQNIINTNDTKAAGLAIIDIYERYSDFDDGMQQRSELYSTLDYLPVLMHTYLHPENLPKEHENRYGVERHWNNISKIRLYADRKSDEMRELIKEFKEAL